VYLKKNIILKTKYMAERFEIPERMKDFDVKVQSKIIAQLLKACKATLARDQEIAGVTFISQPKDTVRTDGTGNIDFYLERLKAVVTLWKIISPTIKSFEFWEENDSEKTLSINVSESTDASRTAVEVGISDIDVIEQANYFNQTREFDLVFVSFEQICKLGCINPDTFDINPTGYGYYASEPSAPSPENMYIQVSRAFMIMDSEERPGELEDLGKFRTLKFNPYPKPVLRKVEKRPVLAYILGVPCPPIWEPNSVRAEVSLAPLAIERNLISPEPVSIYRASFWVKVRANGRFYATIAALVIILIVQLFRKGF
jgi:hypothetical protein